jgi:hypothetical protein
MQHPIIRQDATVPVAVKQGKLRLLDATGSPNDRGTSNVDLVHYNIDYRLSILSESSNLDSCVPTHRESCFCS